MLTHVVVSGECLSSIAAKYGFRQWQTVYNAPENADFRQLRPNPNVIYPGDEIVIPDKEAKDDPGDTEQHHKFKSPGAHWLFRLRLLDEEFNPLEGFDYELDLEGKDIRRGQTGSGGVIEERIGPEVFSGKLLFLGEELDLRLGELNPVTRVKGVQQRLNNLGYASGPVDGIVGPLTRNAVRNFQADQPDLDDTGQIDDKTRQRLLELHDLDDQAKAAEEDMGYQEVAESAGEKPETDDVGPDEAAAKVTVPWPEDYPPESEEWA